MGRSLTTIPGFLNPSAELHNPPMSALGQKQTFRDYPPGEIPHILEAIDMHNAQTLN